MLISDSHKFIFLRMRKVASTSIQEILRPLCVVPPPGALAHLKSRARLEWDYRRYRFHTHDGILAARRRMPAERFEGYFKFSLVRNPWERLVSEYEFIRTQPEHGRYSRVRQMDQFSDFIRMQIKRRDAYQINMLCDNNDNLLLDFIGKLENLDADWPEICRRIGIPCLPLPRKNVTARKPFQEYFDRDSIRLVAEHWAREIELFSYHFD